jgi:hypothetical protein
MPPALNPIFMAVGILLLSGCSAISGGCRSAADQCLTYGPASGEILNGTSCAVLVQVTHVCTYDSEGRFKGTDYRPSGACFCLSQ